MILLNGLPAYLGVGLTHLTIINIFVIIAEIIFLKWFSKLEINKGYIIIANVISAILGLIIASIITDKIGGNFWDGYINEPKSRRSFIIGLVLFVCITIIIELPFYWLALMKKIKLRRLILLTSAVNLITNIPIAFYYYYQKLNYIDD